MSNKQLAAPSPKTLTPSQVVRLRTTAAIIRTEMSLRDERFKRSYASSVDLAAMAKLTVGSISVGMALHAIFLNEIVVGKKSHRITTSKR